MHLLKQDPRSGFIKVATQTSTSSSACLSGRQIFVAAQKYHLLFQKGEFFLIAKGMAGFKTPIRV